MGLFGKKKECDFCGGEIGLLGNRKLEDGNMCKACAAKLSPWFSGRDRKKSTVAEIGAQLQAREANKQAVASFQNTRTLGSDYYMVYLDDVNGKFMVTDKPNLREANPDVLDIASVTSAKLEIQDSRHEEKRQGPDGKEVSYNPPRYRYDYDFYINVTLNHPYVDDMRFRLNRNTLQVYDQSGYGSSGFFSANQTYSPGERDAMYQQFRQVGDQIVMALTGQGGMQRSMGQPAYGAPAGGYQQPMNQQGYAPQGGYQQPMNQQGGFQQPAGQPNLSGAAGAAAGAAMGMMVCPFCGSTVRPGKFCEACGGSLEG